MIRARVWVDDLHLIARRQYLYVTAKLLTICIWRSKRTAMEARTFRKCNELILVCDSRAKLTISFTDCRRWLIKFSQKYDGFEIFENAILISICHTSKLMHKTAQSTNNIKEEKKKFTQTFVRHSLILTRRKNNTATKKKMKKMFHFKPKIVSLVVRKVLLRCECRS